MIGFLDELGGRAEPDFSRRDVFGHHRTGAHHGVFPDGGDFILKDSRVYVSEDDTPTPFVFERNENDLVIKIFDDDIDTVTISTGQFSTYALMYEERAAVATVARIG